MPACAVSRSDRLWEQILSRSSKFKSMKAKTFCPFAQMRMSNHLSNVLLAQWHWACVCVFPNFNEGLRLRPGGSELDLVAPTQSGTIHLELVSLCSSNQKSLAKRRGVGGPAKCQMSEFDMRVTYQWQLLH